MPFKQPFARVSDVFVGLIFAITLVFSSFGGASQMMAQDFATSKLTLRIVGAKDSNGQIAIAVFNGAPGFPGDKSRALRTVQIRIDPITKSAQVTLPDLPRGLYAIAVFHDENMNGQLDKNMFGVPKEGYGFSNISKKAMGAPKFADAKFQLDQPEQSMEIKLLY